MLLNFKMLRLKRGWMQLGIFFLKMEKHTIGGDKKGSLTEKSQLKKQKGFY